MKLRLLKKIFIIFLCLGAVVSLASCTKKDNVKDTLTVYVLGEGTKLPYDQYTTYDIENDSIVMVSEEGFVSALNVGETIITVNGKDKTEKYKVLVKDNRDEDDKRFKKFSNIDDLTAYIGAGINLLTSGNPSSSNCILENQILDTQKIADSKKLNFSDEAVINTVMIQGDTMEEFAEDYSTQIKVGGTAKYGKMFSASIDTDFSSTASMKDTTQTSYLRFFSNVSKMRLNLSMSRKELMSVLTDEFKEDLFGEGKVVLTPEEVINKYGSHLILSAMYGGRMDFTYFLSSRDTKTSKEDMKKISAEVSTSVFKFSADVNGSYSAKAKEMAESKNVSIYAKSNVIGGGLLDMSSIEAMRANYSKWLTSLGEVANYSMIGLVNENSLLEIWSFLPDGARKNEFITYFATSANASYNSLLSKYSKTTTKTTTLTLGQYPQSRAPLNVTTALNNNEGVVVGSFFEKDDVLLYNNNKYLKYIPTRTANSYEAGKTYYFKFEPIKWKYYTTDLNGQKLYTTEFIIDSRQWYSGSDSEYKPYANMSMDEKLEVFERYVGKFAFERMNEDYNRNPSGCANIFEFINKYYHPHLDRELEPYYNRIISEKTGSIDPNTWESSTLRYFLNNKFVKYSFKHEELEKLGLVHSYSIKVKGSNEYKSVIMDYVNISPNMNPKTDGNYYESRISATDFAYARGLVAEAPYWASRSDFVNINLICAAHNDVMAYTFFDTRNGLWVFGTPRLDDYCGVRPTIALR